MKTQVPSFRFMLVLTGIVMFLLFSCGKLAALNVGSYAFSATSGTFSQIQGIPGAVSPALSIGTLDDGCYNSIPIGFPFTFEGVTYSTISASTNGWFTFGSTLSGTGTTNNLTTATVRPIVAPLWDDLALNASGCFTYYLSGSYPNRIFTVEWLNVRWSYLSGLPGIEFQVKLYESNKRVEFIYRQLAGGQNSPSASIGIAGVVTNVFMSLNATSASPGMSSLTETTTLIAKPATGQIYRFDTYAMRPSITSVSPLSGLLNTTVTISGSNFSTNLASNHVWFGATKATVISASYSTLTVFVPVGATHEPLSVTTSDLFCTDYAPRAYDVNFGCAGTITTASYAPKVDYSLGTTARYVAICDIDGDGKTDMAAGNDLNNRNVSIFRNTSTPGVINAASFAPKVDFATSPLTGNVVFGDMDGDGKPEMVVAGYASGDSISVYRNTSTPGVINFAQRMGFTIPGDYPTVKLGDIDGDGKTDLVVTSRWGDHLSIYRNTSVPGSITLSSFAAPITFTTGGGPYDLAIGDIDGDGRPDVCTANSTSNTISVFRNTATAGTINASSFAARVDFTSGSMPMSIQVTDVDGDGKLDVVNSNNTGSSFSVLRNTSSVGSVSFAAKVDIAVAASPHDLAVGDLNGDGQVDVAVGQQGGTVSAIENTSTPGVISFAAFVPYTMSSFGIVIGDLDGDAKPEIITAHLGWAVSVLRNVMGDFSTIVPATMLNSTSYCDNGIWQTFNDPANPTRVLAAIKDNGNNLGAITVSEYKDPAPGNYLGNRFLARHFKITPTAQPTTPVQVRLYFTAAELTALQAVDPSVFSAANLSVTKYDGPTEDGVYNPTDATSLTLYPAASITNGTAYGGKYLEFTITGFSEFWIHGGAGVLPIELLSFDAALEGDDVQLSWTTATETNNDFFTIEKTSDGMHFETVAVVDGAGNSTQVKNYQCADAAPYEGVSYYRLKQTDFNGQFSYSEFKTVEYTSEESLFTVFPNPGNGMINVVCPGEKETIVTLEVFDHMGRLVQHEELSIGEMEHQPVTLPQGVFSLVVTRNSTRFVRQVVVF